jgi:hypothetical protein
MSAAGSPPPPGLHRLNLEKGTSSSPSPPPFCHQRMLDVQMGTRSETCATTASLPPIPLRKTLVRSTYPRLRPGLLDHGSRCFAYIFLLLQTTTPLATHVTTASVFQTHPKWTQMKTAWAMLATLAPRTLIALAPLPPTFASFSNGSSRQLPHTHSLRAPIQCSTFHAPHTTHAHTLCDHPPPSFLAQHMHIHLSL